MGRTENLSVSMTRGDLRISVCVNVFVYVCFSLTERFCPRFLASCGSSERVEYALRKHFTCTQEFLLNLEHLSTGTSLPLSVGIARVGARVTDHGNIDAPL